MSEEQKWYVLKLEFPYVVEEKYEKKAEEIQNIRRKMLENEKEYSKKEKEFLDAHEKEDDDLSDDNEDEDPIVKPREDLSVFTHSLFYRPISIHEVEIRNPPLANNDEELKELLAKAFSVFGAVLQVDLPSENQEIENIIVSFKHSVSLRKSILLNETYSHQTACNVENFGVDRYIEQFKRLRPPLEELESVSNKEIEAFEKQEADARARAGTSKIARHTEAEMKAIIEKYKQKEEAMFSKDFYGFQQKTLYTALLSEDDKPAPRHLKKQPKKKMQKPTK